MWFIRQILWKILLYAFLVFFVVTYWNDYWFTPLEIWSTWWASDFVLYLLLWAVFRVVYDLLRRVVKIITKPLSWVTLGLVWVLINIIAIYWFAYIVTFVLELGITVQPWTPLEIVIFSLIVRLIDVIF